MKLNIQPDKEKAKSLLALAQITLERLKEINPQKYPANTLTDYYDTIHKLLESLCLANGIKIKGDGAHQELIDYICASYQFTEADRIFLQELREYRNKISYEGLNINPSFIKINSERIELIILKLKSLIKF